MSLPRAISEKGDGIYKAKYKRVYEKRYFGQYVAIDLETSEAFVAPNAAAAEAARRPRVRRRPITHTAGTFCGSWSRHRGGAG
jgi:hypothetical protein